MIERLISIRFLIGILKLLDRRSCKSLIVDLEIPTPGLD